MNGSKKGSAFERQICTQLSLWWSGGTRTDIFWRSSQSGGRATQRAKFGKRTFGSYGDIAAVDPIGQPLMRCFTIELKRGRSHGCPNDLLDCKCTPKEKPFEATLNQAIRSATQAQSFSWLLIVRRDGRVSMVYADPTALRTLDPTFPKGIRPPYIVCTLLLHAGKGRQRARQRFVGMQLDEFLRRFTPEMFKKALS